MVLVIDGKTKYVYGCTLQYCFEFDLDCILDTMSLMHLCFGLVQIDNG